MSNKIKEMSWVEFDKRRKETSLVIIPTGAIEVYGPQLPLGTDFIVAEELSALVADKVNALISPAVEMGESSSLMEFPGTMAITMNNYESYMENVIQLLIGHGFKNFLFMNGHGGNTCIITYLCKKYQRLYGIKCAQIDVWQFVEKHGGEIFEFKGNMAHGHAAESNTSMMLYLRPELVKMELAEKIEPMEDEFYDVLKYVEFKEKTPIGVIGDPTVATAEKGRKIVNKCVERIVEFIQYYY